MLRDNDIDWFLQRKDMRFAIQIIEELVRDGKVNFVSLCQAYKEIKLLRLNQVMITKQLRGFLNGPKAKFLDAAALMSILQSTYKEAKYSTFQERVLATHITKELVSRIDTLKMNDATKILCYNAGLKMNVQLPTFSYGSELDELIYLIYVARNLLRTHLRSVMLKLTVKRWRLFVTWHPQRVQTSEISS